jgi:hypothetical protein
MPAYESKQARVERLFKIRVAQKADAPVAVRDYRMAQDAASQQLRRLRDERLSREAQTAYELKRAPPIVNEASVTAKSRLQ